MANGETLIKVEVSTFELSEKQRVKLVFAATQEVINKIFNGNGRLKIGESVYSYFQGKITTVLKGREQAIFRLVRGSQKGEVNPKEVQIPVAMLLAA